MVSSMAQQQIEKLVMMTRRESLSPGEPAPTKASVASSIQNGLPRSFDVVASGIGLVLCLPLLLLVAVIVWLTSPGGILFKQKRVGRNGELFTLYKLRTMTPSNSGSQVTSSNDARITRVGKFLRRTKIDELPTLWNVLRGDMSWVGPRPEVPRYVDLQSAEWQLVLKAKPGITDPVTVQLRDEEKLLAQVDGDPEKYYINELQPLKLRGYLAYLTVRTWRSDFNLLWQTAAAVIFPTESHGQGLEVSERDTDPRDLRCAANTREHSE
jgi:lipopolysaccharide/colanic/teichoic acid biosynthesis glycosyltransferase